MRPFVAFLAIFSLAIASSISSADPDIIEVLASSVCKNDKGSKHMLQIAGTSGLNRLINFIDGLNGDHKLYKCRAEYLESLKELLKVVETSADDICGEEKLSAIEAYHYKYVSRISKFRKLRKTTGKAPRMAKEFFMHYVSQVSSACEQSALATIAKENQHQFSAEELAAVEKLSQITDTLGMTDLKSGYKGIYLFWNMVDSLAVAEQDKFSKYVTKSGDVRVNVQLKDASTLNKLNALCHYQMKPLYSKTLLPVLRLIDMGYYPHGDQLESQLSSQDYTRLLFYVTQICETFKSVRAFSDNNLAEDQLIALTIDEANSLTPPQFEISAELLENQETVDVAKVSIPVETLAAPLTKFETIKSDVNSRSKVINRLLKHLLKHLKNKLKPTLGKFKLFHRGQNQNLEEIDENILEQADENSLQLREANDGTELSRRKRGFWSDFGGAVVAVIFVVVSFIFCVIWYSLKIAVLIAPSIPIGFVGLFSKRARKILHKMWFAGPSFRPFGTH